VDTLTSPPNLFYLFSLWGSSPTNLWAVGPADESVNSLWHYDGHTWKKTTQRLSSNLVSIYGFDSTDIWTCDSPGGDIFHYNGASWTKTGFFPYPGYSLTYLNNIWGPAPNEIYIAGVAWDQTKGSIAILMQYNANQWSFVNLPPTNSSLIWVRKSIEDNNLYFTAVEYITTGTLFKILLYDRKNIIEIYSGSEPATVNEINKKIFITLGKKIHKYINDKLEVWKDFTGTTYIGRVWGRSEKDFFGVASNGLAHYNGSDLKTIYTTDLFIDDLLVMEKDIFMLCENRIIIHGKLKNE
ncbi:MAG: hypothetical protein KKG93_05105, partial [Bacteroidetes bacterium]|nr:hypothetical protein [Bacteroidota bacterium]